MNLYLISQELLQDYDTYDSAIVAAESADQARATEITTIPGAWPKDTRYVAVKLIGVANIGTESGVILASFNAG